MATSTVQPRTMYFSAAGGMPSVAGVPGPPRHRFVVAPGAVPNGPVVCGKSAAVAQGVLSVSSGHGAVARSESRPRTIVQARTDSRGMVAIQARTDSRPVVGQQPRADSRTLTYVASPARSPGPCGGVEPWPVVGPLTARAASPQFAPMVPVARTESQGPPSGRAGAKTLCQSHTSLTHPYRSGLNSPYRGSGNLNAPTSGRRTESQGPPQGRSGARTLRPSHSSLTQHSRSGLNSPSHGAGNLSATSGGRRHPFVAELVGNTALQELPHTVGNYVGQVALSQKRRSAIGATSPTGLRCRQVQCGSSSPLISNTRPAGSAALPVAEPTVTMPRGMQCASARTLSSCSGGDAACLGNSGRGCRLRAAAPTVSAGTPLGRVFRSPGHGSSAASAIASSARLLRNVARPTARLAASVAAAPEVYSNDGKLVSRQADSSTNGRQQVARSARILEESNVVVERERRNVVCAEAESLCGLVPEIRPNSLTKFFREAICKVINVPFETFGCQVDVTRYWEKRRVQTLLRSWLEFVLERYEFQHDVQASELASVFQSLATGGIADTIRGPLLHKDDWSQALSAAGLWPPDFSASDRSEMFTALLVPSFAAARAVLCGELKILDSMSSQELSEGFSRVPFNLPDFPVPAAIQLHPSCSRTYSAEQTDAVADAIAKTFGMESTGLNKVKDFFISGLLSLEEVQVSLPKLVPLTLVEDAVTQIICRGAVLFSPEEWDAMVVVPRYQESQGGGQGATAEDSSASSLGALPPTPTKHSPPKIQQLQLLQAQATGGKVGTTHENSTLQQGLDVSLNTPEAEHREVRLSGIPALGRKGAAEQVVATPIGPGTDCNIELSLAADHSRFRGRQEPVTEPLPTRDLKSEEPVRFCQGVHAAVSAAANGITGPLAPTIAARLLEQEPDSGESLGAIATGRKQIAERLVHWNTVELNTGANGHQADVGAGSRISWGTRGFNLSLQEKASALDTRGSQVDHFAWINMDLHAECGGPFLAKAFVRCCQMYETDQMKAK